MTSPLSSDGPAWGLLVASPASVLAAVVAVALGRTVLRDWIRTRIDRYPKARALDTAIGTRTFKLIVLLRLPPVIPFNILNYPLGLSDAKVGRYVVASFIGMLPVRGSTCISDR
ncbi:MAG: VTT domain-containing protein [Vicinamibacterales bacterium]